MGDDADGIQSRCYPLMWDGWKTLSKAYVTARPRRHRPGIGHPQTADSTSPMTGDRHWQLCHWPNRAWCRIGVAAGGLRILAASCLSLFCSPSISAFKIIGRNTSFSIQLKVSAMSSASVLTTVSNLRNLDKMTNFVRASALALTRRWILERPFPQSDCLGFHHPRPLKSCKPGFHGIQSRGG